MRMFPPRAARSRASAFVLALGALGLLAAVAATARADPKVLAKVDGVAITEDDFNDALADIGPGLPEKLEGPEREKYVLDYLIDLRLVAKQALADKLDGTRRLYAPFGLLSRQAGDGGAADQRGQIRHDGGGRAQGV